MEIFLQDYEVKLLIESLEIDLNGDKLDGYHRTVYRNLLAKLKEHENN